MESRRSMTLKKLLAGLMLTIMTSVMVFAAPLSSALTVDFDFGTQDQDRAQGDVTQDDCANLDQSLAASLGCDTDDEVIDFTEYRGEFEGPDAAGYDSALTQNTSAREFIQTIVNYALSFLGLVATLMVIYGGVLYVTSRGDEEATSKGKKTIGYAVMGIVIILASFAIVNTVIGAGGGGNASGGNGQGVAGGTGSSISQAGAAFDVDGVLDEIEDIIRDYQDTYDTYLRVSQEVAFMQSVEMPLVMTVDDIDATVGGLAEYMVEWASGQDDDLADQYTLIDQRDIDDYIDEIREGILDIQSSVDTYSDTYEAAQSLFNYLRSGTRASLFIPTAHAANGERLSGFRDRVANAIDRGQELVDVFEDYTQGVTTGGGCNYFSSGTAIDYSLFGLTAYEMEVSNIDDYICGMLEQIQTAADEDYERQVGELIERFTQLGLLFDTSGTETGSGLQEVKTLHTAAMRTLTDAQNSVNAQTVRNIVDAMNNLYVRVQALEFVDVQLRASVIEGNAPLIVRFDALGTEDPSGLTVQDSQISWDLEGDGVFVNRESDGSLIGDATSYTYTEAGTYRVKVKVTSQDSNIAAGLATVTVVVQPAKSVIILDATAGGETTTLADFSTFPAIDNNTYKVTMTEAQQGIEFDASGSTDGDGNSNGLIFAEWDFGDSETESGAWSTTSRVTHAYGEAGIYDVVLTVTDETGVEDRKYFKLYVASPAARISYSPSSGAVGTEFTLDGSGSTTDIGTIINYRWSASLNGAPYTLGSTSGSSIRAEFDRPGVYGITLTVADSSANTDSASVNIVVSSQAPVALFDYTVPQSYQPATVVFDASDSYDPDEGDTITYEWDFGGEEDTDYIILEGSAESEEVTVQFLNVDAYDVSLTVYDQHEGELKRSSTTTETVNIRSVLDVDLEITGDQARHLDQDGEANVEFTAYSQTATGFEIDYGDGSVDFTETISRGQSIINHTYTQAGVFYVRLTAYDEENNTNSITRRVYVAQADSPIAVINVSADGEDIGFGDTLTGNVNTRFTFSSDSINVDGSNRNLSYSWNFGDGSTSAQRSATHTFDEHATYTVSLTVKDTNDPSISDTATIRIMIEGLAPEIRGVSITPQGNTLETPLKVNVNVDAVDEDGRINYYEAYYYDINNSTERLGTLIAQTNNFTITVNTNGEEGEEKTYVFVVEVTDNDDNSVSSLDELGEANSPSLEVTNGPNDSPVANFSVDRSSVFVGEPITFSSTSYDTDGSIRYYWWDLEGDGFFNNERQTTGSLEHTFSQVYSDGVEVSLRVEDDAGATAISEPVRIYVDANSTPPDAAFLADVEGTVVSFRDNSIIDTENGAERFALYWDFDTSVDSNGNGVPDDDKDSIEVDPIHDYEELGTYTVQLTVVDSTGQSDILEQDVQVIDAQPPVAAFTYEVENKTVSFRSQSTTDTDKDVTVRSYEWTFDVDNSEAIDSTKKNPSFEYDDYGFYEVQLRVTDTLGNVDIATETVEVPNPIQPVEAVLTAVPQPNSLNQVLLNGTSGDVTFYFSAEGGSGNYRYEFDKNIFFDTEGDRVRDNDADYTASRAGNWRTTFFESYGQIVVKLSVTDLQTGESDIATLQVVFQGSSGGANLFNATPTEMSFLILSALLTAILGVSLFFSYKPSSSRK